ncbi:MAG: hypothetical protein IH991_04790 [Planctomycetes bacterium]|nr:hypothetical protein [Planctomycetota bacterium]
MALAFDHAQERAIGKPLDMRDLISVGSVNVDLGIEELVVDRGVLDQVIATCLKYCVPVAAVGFLGAVFWQVADLPSPSDIAPVKSQVIDTRTGELVIDAETGEPKMSEGMGGVREYWLLHSGSSANEASQAGEGPRPDESAQFPPLESKKGGDG